jgi:hypothetical protein
LYVHLAHHPGHRGFETLWLIGAALDEAVHLQLRALQRQLGRGHFLLGC